MACARTYPGNIFQYACDALERQKNEDPKAYHRATSAVMGNIDPVLLH